MSDPGKAVFLSYASQDAEAAKRIADTLRAAGVEVWFDADGGLEHGDEWDAKIRRQIKECVLFIPIISANTQAREEGYFRLEWDLASERARTIASGVAFILPVVVDDTREPDALVPDRFRTVQWTRLPGGTVPPEVLQRFLKLWSHRTGALKQAGEAGRPRPAEERGGGTPPQKDSRPRWLAPVLAGLAVGVLALVLTRPWERLGISAASASPAAAPVSEAEGLIAKAWAQMNKAELARAELDVADGFCHRATDLDPSNAEAWAAWSQVDAWFVYHDFDQTQTRREGARTKAAHALQLAPGSYEARLAQACYLVRRPGGGGRTISMFDDEARGLLTALLREKPSEPRALLALGILQRNTGRPAEARATLEKLAENPAFAALAWNEIGWVAYLAGDPTAAGVAADRSIGLQPCWPNLALKVLLSELWTGDLDQAKAMLEKIPVAVREEDHGVAMSCQLYWYRREPENMLRVLGGVTRDWLRSNAFDGPKAYWVGLAQEMAGRKEVARVQWQAALQQVDQRLAVQPDAGELLRWKGELVARLGRRDEAGKLFQLARESGAGNPNWLGTIGTVTDLILLGQNDEAIATLEKSTAISSAAGLRIFPPLDPLRADPRFQALLAGMEADPRYSPKAKAFAAVDKAGAPSLAKATEDRSPPDQKSVAVLAFANLSDDKANEYFSDGISEELLNVLAKVPGLKVSARTSAFHFKGKDTPIPEIAQQLGVAYVVEGSVRKQGDKVRITAQLIKAADGFHVWSDTFTRDLKDIFAVQDEIAGLIAQQLQLKLGETARPAAPINPEAFELYVQARQAWNRRNMEGYTRAEDLLNRAIALEPRFARAHAALADVWRNIGENGDTLGRFDARDSAGMQRIVKKAREAVQLDPESAEAHAALGSALWMGWNWAEAERELRRAIALNPNYASAHQWLGRVLGGQGWLTEALAELKLAVEADPLSSRIVDNYAACLDRAGRYSEALAQFDRALALQPNNIQALTLKGLLLAKMGRAEEAVAIARGLARDDDFARFMRMWILYWAGRQDEARAAAREVSSLPRAARAFGIEGPVHWLELLDPGSVYSTYMVELLLIDRYYDPVRPDPRFAKLLATLSLTEAHARAQAWRQAHPPEGGGQK